MTAVFTGFVALVALKAQPVFSALTAILVCLVVDRGLTGTRGAESNVTDRGKYVFSVTLT